VKRDMAPDELRGVRVLAMNVKRLGPDNANPMAYRHGSPTGRSSSPRTERASSRSCWSRRSWQTCSTKANGFVGRTTASRPAGSERPFLRCPPVRLRGRIRGAALGAFEVVAALRTGLLVDGVMGAPEPIASIAAAG